MSVSLMGLKRHVGELMIAELSFKIVLNPEYLFKLMFLPLFINYKRTISFKSIV